MDALSFNYIHDEMLYKELPLNDTVYESLHPDRTRALNVFARIIENSVREYYNHYPVVLVKNFDNGLVGSVYTFKDNFEMYRKGILPEEEIELVPEAIGRILSGYANKLTSNNWRYEKPTLTVNGGASRVTYFAFPPVHWEISPDGKFTEDSKVYYASSTDDDVFMDIVAYNLLNYLQTTRNSVILPTGLQFFDFTARMAELKEDILEYFAVSDRLYRMY